MNTKQTLEDLDKHAAEFNFPMFNNEYLEFADSRLTVFRSTKHWLMVFEILGFSIREPEFANVIYAYGSCIDRQGFVGEEIPVSSLPEHPVLDPETNECIADWSYWSVKIRGEKMSFSPSQEEYAEAGIRINRNPGRGSLKEIELLRFLVHLFGASRFFLSDHELLQYFPMCTDVKKFIQTTRWQHPDVALQEKPSRNISIYTLVEAVSRGDASVFDQGSPNTDWRVWA